MMDISCRDAPGLLAVQVFASRLTRRALLRRFCPSDHPVLAIEEDLIEMARSKLQEHILASYPRDDIPGLREAVHAAMRQTAVEKVTGYDEDETVREELVEEVCAEPIDDVLLEPRR